MHGPRELESAEWGWFLVMTGVDPGPDAPPRTKRSDGVAAGGRRRAVNPGRGR